jgi:hypothetical protein
MKDENRELALEYHRSNLPGKLAIRSTKPLANQHDLTYGLFDWCRCSL